MTPPQTTDLERTAPSDVLGDPADGASVDPLGEALADIAATERMIRWVQAQQYLRIEAARRLHAEAEGVTGASGSTERDMATRSFVAELATVLVAPEATAGRLAADAGRLAGPRADTLAALAAGSVGAAHVRSMLELTSDLPADVAAALEQHALDDAGNRTSTAFRQRVRRLRERLHPESLASRRRRAADERRIHLDPAPDGMAWLGLFIEAERAVAIVDRLDALAAASAERVGQAPGTVPHDARTLAQRCVDLAADLLMSGLLDEGSAADTRRIVPRVTVTVPVLSMLGATDEPAELDGYGPIDAETARVIAARAERAPTPRPPRDRCRAVVRPHRLPGPSRPRRLPARARRPMPLPGVLAARRPLRPRPHDGLGARRRHRRRQPRPPLPKAPPTQARERMARGRRAGRRDALDLAGRARAPDVPRGAVRPRSAESAGRGAARDRRDGTSDARPIALRSGCIATRP